MDQQPPLTPGSQQTETILLGSKIKIEEGFDPDNIDISFVEAYINDWPKDGILNLTQVESLAAKSLIVLNLVSDLVAKVLRYYELAQASVHEEFAMGQERSGASSVSAQKELARKDTLYQDALRDEAKAKAALKFLTGKHGTIEKMHYLCKEGVKQNTQQQRRGGGSTPVEADYSDDAVGDLGID